MVESHTAIRTLIPEAGSYGIAILVVLGLGSSALAADLRARWFVGTRVRIFHVYSAVLAFTSLWGLLVLDTSRLLGTSVLAWGLALPVGLAAGAIAKWSDRAILRSISRRSVLRRRRGYQGRTTAASTARSGPRPSRATSVPFAGQPATRRELSLHRVGQRFERAFTLHDAGVWPYVVAAALEEVVYRGFLVGVCFLLPGTVLIAFALAGTVVAFALTHIWFGWEHVAAKLPLGAATLVAALVLGTALPAIVAHVVFNVGVWKDARAAFPVPASPRRLTPSA
jgi:hypothetical protein